jgi:peptidoglycan/xylan/chitin deacetylase (PgdA/CDA1 family)
VPLLLLLDLAGKVGAILLGRSAPTTALALWFLPDALLAYHVFMPRAQGIVAVARRFATARREVWLTIDDGPDPEDTPRILALLAAHKARATFFVVGENAAQYPQLVRAIVAAGHEVALHTHTHPSASFWCASPARVRREIALGLESLRRAGTTATRFRPPVGIKNPWLRAALRSRGLTCIGWTARGLECWHRDVKRVIARVTRRIEPGAILLLHEGPGVPAPLRVAAIAGVLERLRAQNYRCVIPTAQQLAAPQPARPVSAPPPRPAAAAATRGVRTRRLARGLSLSRRQ